MQRGPENRDVRTLRKVGRQLRSLLEESHDAAMQSQHDESGEMGKMPLKASNAHAFEEMVQEQLARITAQLETLGQRLDEERTFAPQRPEEVPGYAELKTALHNLVEHLELAEGRTAEAIGDLREQLQSVAKRTAEALQLASSSNADGESGSTLQALEERITRLDAGLNEMQRAVSEETRAYVDSCLGDITRKMAAIEQQAAKGVSHDVLARLVREQMEEQAQAQMQQTEERMAALVSRLQGKLEELAAGVMDIDRLRTDVEQLDTQVRQMREELASKADRKELETLQETLNELAAQLKAVHAKGAPQDDSRLQALEQRVLEIHQLVEETVGEPLALISEKLAAHEQQLASLAEQPRDDDAASRLAVLEKRVEQLQQMLHTQEQQDGDQPSPAHDEQLATLKAGLADLEAFTRKAEGHTREMLKAMQETLAEVVERVMALEERSASDAPAQPAAAPAQPAAAPAQPAAAPAQPAIAAAAPDMAMSADGEKDPVATLLGDPAPQQAVVQDAAAGKEAPAMPASGKEQHEAATAGNGAVSAQSLVEEVRKAMQELPASKAGHQQPQMASANSPGHANASGSGIAPSGNATPDDFIAAARRAAWAANDPAQEANTAPTHEKKGLLARFLPGKKAEWQNAGHEQQQHTGTPAAPQPEEDAEAKAGGWGSRISVLRSQRASRANASDSAQGDAAAAAGNRRRLMLAGVVVLAAAALFVSRQQSHAPAPQPAAMQQGKAVQQVHGSAVPSPAAGKKHKPAGKKAAGKRQSWLDETSSGLYAPTGNGGIHTASISAAGDEAAPSGKPVAAAPQPGNASPASAAMPPVHAGDAQQTADGGQEASMQMLPASIGPAALRSAALKGDGKAAFLVATRYLKGEGVPRDLAKAVQWLRKAANAGIPVAMLRLGIMHEHGAGVSADPLQAKMWYERAALRGNVRAMHNLAVLLASGKAGVADYEQAARWFRKAAEHGMRDSQFNLAVLYHRGLGVERSLTDAWFWYSAAAKQGDSAAAEQAKKLAAWLPGKELAKAQKKLAAFTPMPPIRNANVVVIDHPEWRTASAAAKHAKPLKGKALIAEVQRLLKKVGYDVGPVDGVMGNRTANAIRLFQLQSRLPVNGQPDMALLERLRQQAGQGA